MKPRKKKRRKRPELGGYRIPTTGGNIYFKNKKAYTRKRKHSKDGGGVMLKVLIHISFWSFIAVWCYLIYLTATGDYV